MLNKIIDEKINEIFLEYQEANNIESGDISPMDSLRLDEIKEQLADLIRRVSNV